ncbi:starch synthase [Arcanobacterium wilhelmae]|uniref:Starch synthase n=1 Tax=Arcanobacterium wilhelmae TaxID=1803177 RepID=A0ABT9N8V8_9ACTO|nr:glycogen synthase [Arcanobacterium wilhelmae]MDP9799950.1 starch synthase [Arcanobacterium wilhelmae]WFN91084.1 glycogen synthase [Arcanobacterium wilhelmae]
MRVDLFSREFPPHVYGGAGVHVTELSRVLALHADVHVHAFDGPRPTSVPGVTVHGYDAVAELSQANSAIGSLGVDLEMVAGAEGADIVHSHTWYANMAGHLAKLLYGVPHVISAHSLEPLRPWKREQLGGGYQVSSWMERTAYESADAIIAVSNAMKEDILRVYPAVREESVHVIHNGIDLDAWKAPQTQEEWVAARERFRATGLDPERPTIVFVGRITRQKGVPYLLRALKYVDLGVQVLLLAGAPDTPEIAKETRSLVEELQREREGVVWIDEHLPHTDIVALESCSTTFVTPSIYEPLGIVNLEAMGVGLPVVGTNTGGIPDCIVHGETGLLVDIEQLDDGTGTPLDPPAFERALGEALQAMVTDPQRAAQMGAAGRSRVEEHFAWHAIGEQTMKLYTDVVASHS